MKQKDYDLLQATIQQGVDALGEYFREQVGKKIHLIESDGIEDYPERGIPAASAMRLLLQKMPSFTDEQYFFSDRSRTLVLKVSLRDEGRQLYVCISDVNAKEIRSVMGAVEPARTALAYILRGCARRRGEDRRRPHQCLRRKQPAICRSVREKRPSS